MSDDNFQSADSKGADGGVDSSLMNQEAPPKREGGICAPWIWFKQKPLQRWQFAVFLIFGFLTILWLIMYILQGAVGYILAGISAIVMSGYGANHFRILLGLKEEVDRMSGLNREFRAENAALKQEVDKLSRAREQLSSVEAGLKESNRKLKENVEKFKKLDENLKKLSDSNIEGLEKLQESSKQVMRTMHESLVRHEKEILNKVYDHLEWKTDDKDGLTKDEFEDFLNALPESYRIRFEAMHRTFEELAAGAGDDNTILEYDEFTALVDNFAEQEAAAGGSQ